MSVQTKVENYLNYITGSGGGWPSNTNIGIMAGIDYIKEETTNNIYFHEMNTACGVYGSYATQMSVFNKISDYVNEQGCSTAYVYGQNDSRKRNPSSIQEPLISSSFARHNISVNFEYNDNTSITYFSQRGNTDHSDKFHLFMQTPWYSDDNLLEIVSGSFNKTTFRGILNSSPESSSVVPLFNTSSFVSSNPYHPDFLVKTPTQDGTAHGETGLEFYKYVDSNDTYQNAVNSGSYLIEKFLVPSGSTLNNVGYLMTRKMNYLMTPTKQVLLEDKQEFAITEAPKFVLDGDAWHPSNFLMYSSISGSSIDMYDGSTKQVQDIQIGDVVKSYKPVGLPDESFYRDWESYSTSDLSGSTASGSVVIRTFNNSHFGHYLVNGNIKIPIMNQSMMKGSRYFLKQGGNWTFAKPSEISVGDYLFDKNGNEVEITSVSEVGEDNTFYSLDVEDIDTYFTSDVLVHNLPPRKCFTGDTMITLSDGTYHKIKHIELGSKIKTYDVESGKLQNSVVLEVVKVLHDNVVKYRFNNNTEIMATDNHPFFIASDSHIDSDYRPLEVGDEVLNDELNKIKVVSVEKIDGLIETYNINKTDSGKNYFVNKVLVSDESEDT
tara:strand:+ start:833 stop:2650 length:1818 start_codon:yes stop_codon:yes gene_type:complete